jgi:hypothetical protein
MSTYDGVLLRTALDDKGDLPYKGGIVYLSPDIIPRGTDPYTDPQKTLSDDYDKDEGTSLTKNADNYFYMRGKNLSTESISGNFYVYVMEPNLFIYPDQWKDKGLRVASSTEKDPVYNSPFPSTAPGQIAVTTDPFIWHPDTTTHHCAMGRIVSAKNPNPIPQTGTVSSLAAWIINQGGYCWRNLTIVDKGVQWNQSTNYKQGSIGAKMYILVTCSGCPVNSTISFSCGVAGPKPAIYLPPTPITTTQGFITGIHSEVPANYVSNMSITYVPSGPPLPGFDITVTAQYVPPPKDSLYDYGITLSEFGLPEGSHDSLHNKQIQSLRKAEGIGPTKIIQIGAQTYI